MADRLVDKAAECLVEAVSVLDDGRTAVDVVAHRVMSLCEKEVLIGIWVAKDFGPARRNPAPRYSALD